MFQRLSTLFTSQPAPKKYNRRQNRALRLESLEGRELFAVLAGVAPVNTSTAANQSDVAIASAPDGRSVAVWVHDYSTSDRDIYAQRFDSAGNKVGSEIRVATSSRNETQPDVAMDATGDFVVAWTDQVTSSNQDIKVQRYSSSGLTRGTVITIAGSSKNEVTPSIATASNGDFVVAWTVEYSLSDTDIQARRYSDSGVALSSAFTVGDSTNDESYPDVARAPDGRFAISYTIDTNNSDMIVKRYSATGSLVNTHTVAGGSVRQVNGRISMDNNANVMAVWQEYVGSDDDIKARRISNTGVMGTTMTIVNTTQYEIMPDVAYKRDGTAFAVTYYNMSDFSSRVVELTNAGTVRNRSTIASRAVIGSTPIVFGSTTDYRVAYTAPSNGSDIFQRRGQLS